MKAEFEAYAAAATAEYEQYLKSITKIWGGGENSVLTDTRTQWVEYSPNKLSRSIVDFESGEITVEVVIDSDKMQDSSFVEQQMAKAIERMLDSRGSTCPYASTVEVSEPLANKPILDNLVDFSKYTFSSSSDSDSDSIEKKKPNTPPMPKVKGEELKLERKEATPVAKKQAPVKKTVPAVKNKVIKKSEPKIIKKKPSTANVAKSIAKQSKKVISPSKKADGKPAKVVQVKMNLVADNIPKNAALYKDLVSEFSKKFQVEEPLIYAIMEQESAFNPRATSAANAIGLMQIVPNKAGLDAYRYVYKKNKTPEKSYLYNPRNNIELGTAYLKMLSNQFGKVSDVMCRQLCVIASYNTGAGNVSTCFIGTTNLSKALSHIDTYNYNSLYNHLVTKLPYNETRDYVKKVTKKREKYLKNNTNE